MTLLLDEYCKVLNFNLDIKILNILMASSTGRNRNKQKMRTSLLEALDKQTPPNTTIEYALAIAVSCIANVVNSIALLVAEVCMYICLYVL